jgi:hypothetical protein
MIDWPVMPTYRGSQSSSAKLTESQAQQIIDADSSVTDIELAERFGVSTTTVNNIRHRRTWNHLRRTKPVEVIDTGFDYHNVADAVLSGGVSARGIDLAKALETFDTLRWSIACREMQLRVIHGNIDQAKTLLDAFGRATGYTRATMASPLAAVFPVRLANALEEGGYLRLTALDAIDDATLGSIRNVGESAVVAIRKTIAAIKAGQAMELFQEDLDLLDEHCYERRLKELITNQCNCSEQVMPTNPTNSPDAVLQALELVAANGDTAAEVIDAKIDFHKAEIAKLARLRDMVTGPKPKRKMMRRDDCEQRIFDYVCEHGASKVAAIAKALNCSEATIYRALDTSKRLGLQDKLLSLV